MTTIGVMLAASTVVAAFDPVWVKVASASSTAEAKAAADFACAGTNDQETMQRIRSRRRLDKKLLNRLGDVEWYLV